MNQEYTPASSDILFLDREGNENEYEPKYLRKISDYYKKMGMIREQNLPISRDIYGGLERAISSSSFHNLDNEVSDFYTNDFLGAVMQTDAAKELQKVIARFFRKLKIPIKTVVMSLDESDVENNRLQSNKNPDRFIVAAQAGLDDKGTGVLILMAVPAEDDFNPENVNSSKVAQDISSTIRHELVHDKQYTSLATAKNISRLDAKKKFEKWGLIPPEGAPREDYLKSHIEIDAFGHEFAERIAQNMGIDAAEKAVSTADLADMQALAKEVGIAPNFKEYYLDSPDALYTSKLHKKIRKYLKLFRQEGIYESKLLKNIIREQLVYNNTVPNTKWSHLHNQKYPKHIFERSYVEGILGVRVPLNESYPYPPSLERRIIQEHLLFEGFWGELLDKGKEKLLSAKEGIKKFGKEAWNILTAFYSVIKGGAKEIGSFTGAIAKKGINKFFSQIRKALKWMVAKFPGWNMPTFAKWAEKGLDALQKVQDSVNGLDGWKRVIGFAGLAVGLQWLWEKVGSWIDELKEKVGGSFDITAVMGENIRKSGWVSNPPTFDIGSPLGEADDESATDNVNDAAPDAVIGWIKDTAQEKLSAIAGDTFKGIIEKLSSALTGVKPWWDAAKKLAGGAKLVIDALGSAATRFLSRQNALTISTESNPQTESIYRSKGKSMKITKRQLRRIIKEELMAETAPTFNLRSGDSVRHKDEPGLGVGKVVAKGSTRDRVVLVKWETGFTRRHDPSALVKERR